MRGESIETMLESRGFGDYKWLSGKDVLVRQCPRRRSCPT